MQLEIPPVGQMRVTDVHGRMMIVGEAPGAQEDAAGVPFIGPAGRLLMRVLSEHGAVRTDILIANAYWRRPPGNDLGRVPRDELERYAERTREVVRRERPSLVLALGKHALRTLTGYDGPMQDVRGTHLPFIDDPSVLVLPTWHPASVLRQWSQYWAFWCDVRKALRLSREAPAEPPEHFDLHASPEAMIAYMRQVPDGTPVALDIETIPRDHVITYIGIAWRHDRAAVMHVPSHTPEALCTVLAELEELARRCPLIAHNSLYEISWLWLITHTPLDIPWDTQSMHHTLMPEGEKSLHFCASIYLDVQAWKYRANENHALYNARDCAHTWALREVLFERLRAEHLLDFYRTEIVPQQRVAAFLTCRGLRVDSDTQRRLASELRARMEELERIVLAYDINPNSPAQLAQLLYERFGLPPVRSRKTRKPSTDASAIRKLLKRAEREKHAEAATFLSAFQEWKRLRSSLSKDVNVQPDERTRCLHTGYNIDGTETGRWSSSEAPWGGGTNLQNRQKRFRSMFVPHRPGWCFVACDSVQAEAYVVAWLCGDEALIEAFLSGRDLHTYTAALMFGVAENAVTPEQRTIGKRVRHAANYSMSKVTLAEILGTSQAEAAELLERFHRANPLLRSVYFPSIQRALRKARLLERALRTPLGRRRIFTGRLSDDATYREAYAFIPQSTVGDLVNSALHRFFDATRTARDVAVTAQIHDEIVFECPPARARHYALMLKPLMERRMYVRGFDGRVRPLVIPCDFKIGWNLGPRSEDNPGGLRSWNPATQPAEDVLDA